MRLIDADAIEWLQATGYVTVGEEEFGERTYVFIPINSLDELPTINAVPVGRCKDCKNRYTDSCGMFDVEAEWEWTEDNGFCQYGERREE